MSDVTSKTNDVMGTLDELSLPLVAARRQLALDLGDRPAAQWAGLTAAYDELLRALYHHSVVSRGTLHSLGLAT